MALLTVLLTGRIGPKNRIVVMDELSVDGSYRVLTFSLLRRRCQPAIGLKSFALFVFEVVFSEQCVLQHAIFNNQHASRM